MSFRAFSIAVVLIATGRVAQPACAADDSGVVCGIDYSQHLSDTSDAGSDVKNGEVSCSWRSGAGTVRSVEIGAEADTPPVGRRNPISLDSEVQTVSGLPSNQEDTFETFVGYGEEFDSTPGSALLFNLRGGSIDGFSTPIVRGFIDDTHRWEGKGYSRHSPVSSDGRPLLQLSGVHTSELAGTTVSSWRLGLSDVENATVGTSLDALTIGIQASAQASGAVPTLPFGLPGMQLRIPSTSGVYAGVFAQSTLYDIATEHAGTAREYLYAKVGVSFTLGRGLALRIEFTHPLTERVQQQYVAGYNYLEGTLGYRF